jgi:hypothetical protein
VPHHVGLLLRFAQLPGMLSQALGPAPRLADRRQAYADARDTAVQDGCAAKAGARDGPIAERFVPMINHALSPALLARHFDLEPVLLEVAERFEREAKVGHGL